MSETVKRTNYGGTRRFWLDRVEDPTGVSGTGTVAQGIVFSDGSCALRWLTERTSTAVYASLEDLEAIHLHHGGTKIRWADPICFACGSALAMRPIDEITGRWCASCGAGQGDELYYERDPDPSLGSWHGIELPAAAPR